MSNFFNQEKLIAGIAAQNIALFKNILNIGDLKYKYKYLLFIVNISFIYPNF